MKKLLTIWILSFLLGVGVFGCGSSDSVPMGPAISSLTIYQFSATIEYGNTPFSSGIGDVITGTFSFDPSIGNQSSSPDQGVYFQKAPAGVQVVVGSTTLSADLSNWLPYYIDILTTVHTRIRSGIGSHGL